MDDLDDVPAGAGTVPLLTGQASPSVDGGVGGVGGEFPTGVMADDPVGDRNEPKIDLGEKRERGAPMKSP